MVEPRNGRRSWSPRRHPDPAQSADPGIRELIAALAAVPLAAEPRARFRAELRAQLVAVAPRVIADAPTTDPPAQLPVMHRTQSPIRQWAQRLPSLRLGRPIRVALTTFLIIAVAMSGVVWLSRAALPGDTLYGVKRASEDARLSLTTNNVARGKDLLAFAKTRADEVSELLAHPSADGSGPQAGSGVSTHTATLIRRTLASADSDVRQAAQLLGSQAVSDRSAAPLAPMIGWAPAQRDRLDAVAARIPAGPLHDRAATSAELVSAAYDRAEALRSGLGCNCLSSAGTDALGPVPCTTCTHTPPAVPTAPSVPSVPPAGATNAPHASAPVAPPGSRTHGTAQPGTRTPKTSRPTTRTDTPAESKTAPDGADKPATPKRSTSPGPSPTPGPTTATPPATTPTTPPVTVGSCGIGITLGPIGIGIGPCGIHIGL